MSTEDALRRCAEANLRHQERIAALERQLREMEGAAISNRNRIDDMERRCDALREIVRAVAESDPETTRDHGLTVECAWCEAHLVIPEDGSQEHIPHAGDCTWAQARTLLGLNPPAGRTTPPQP